MQPIPDNHITDAHLIRLENEGYTIVPDAIPPDLLGELHRRFDALICDHQSIATSFLHPQTGAIDINSIMEVDPVFTDLLDLPSVFPIAEKALDGELVLLGAPIGNYTPPGAASRGGWHHDGAPYIRLTYFLSDLAEAEGPTAVLPGSHHRKTLPPEWMNDEAGIPRHLPGLRPATGPAGTCLINNTLIWHTGMPNVSQQPRRILWVVFKHAASPDVAPDHLKVTATFAARQTSPLRRRLCGLVD